MDEKWADIFGGRAERGRMPNAPRISVPRVHKPTCAEHCGGRHQTDGVMICPNCRVPAYRVVLHDWFHMEGHHFNSLEPMNGAPPAPPDDSTPVCNCGREMVREFAR